MFKTKRKVFEKNIFSFRKKENLFVRRDDFNYELKAQSLKKK